MKRTVLVATLILALLISLFMSISVNFTSANFSPVLPPDNIIIEADGSIIGTGSIVRNGNVYTFTANVSGTRIIQGNFAGNMSSALAVHKSNIVIDGAGYTLLGSGGTGIDLSNGVCQTPSEREIWNVTIKNLRITNCSWSLRCDFGGNHTFYGDYIANDYITSDDRGILLWGSRGNNITRCTIGGLPAVYMHFGCSDNVVTENNIVAGVSLAISGNETFDRNYWGDYLTRYPNATEIDSLGIGNIPYAFEDSQAERWTFQDNHPLMNPVAIPDFPLALPSVLPSQEPELFPKALIVAAVIIVAVVGVGFLVYFRKRGKKLST
jgi:hypothetical protein